MDGWLICVILFFTWIRRQLDWSKPDLSNGPQAREDDREFTSCSPGHQKWLTSGLTGFNNQIKFSEVFLFSSEGVMHMAQPQILLLMRCVCYLEIRKIQIYITEFMTTHLCIIPVWAAFLICASLIHICSLYMNACLCVSYKYNCASYKQKNPQNTNKSHKEVLILCIQEVQMRLLSWWLLMQHFPTSYILYIYKWANFYELYLPDRIHQHCL